MKVSVLGRERSLVLLSLVFGLVLLGMVFVLGEKFFNVRNIVSMGFQIPEFGFLALAMTLAMLTGGIDLSIIGNMNLAGILSALILTNGDLISRFGESTIIAFAFVVALGVSFACGALNGVFIGFVRVPPILATIGTMLLYAGTGMAITGGRGVVGFPESFMVFGNSSILGIPFSFVLMLIAFVITFLFLKKSVWGKSVYLIGSNYVAALFSGIRTRRTILMTYAIGGLMCGFSALILISRVNSARVGYGNTYLLQAILVSVMGGIDPQGGSGNLLGVLISILILQSLSSSFTLFAITPYARGLIYGLMLITIMVLNNFYGKKPQVVS